MNSPNESDKELNAVAQEIIKLDPDGQRTAQVIRDTLDQLYDGQRTGRYRWDQLYKTEKTHCGTLVEINLQREFQFEDGTILDYKVAGIEVDCKYSQRKGGWMIPPEAHNHLGLVIWAEDSADPKWCMGLTRISPSFLHSSSNRDAKATLNEFGRASIKWLFKDMALPPNVLLQLDQPVVDRIMSHRSGQKRINELFRSTLGKRVGRAVVATVARQDDYMKRVRANGGARTSLQREGIIILGQFQTHCEIARALGTEEPGRGELISVRVVPAAGAGAGVAQIKGRFWRIAENNDPIVTAPDLPKIRHHPSKRSVTHRG